MILARMILRVQTRTRTLVAVGPPAPDVIADHRRRGAGVEIESVVPVERHLEEILVGDDLPQGHLRGPDRPFLGVRVDHVEYRLLVLALLLHVQIALQFDGAHIRPMHLDEIGPGMTMNHHEGATAGMTTVRDVEAPSLLPGRIRGETLAVDLALLVGITDSFVLTSVSMSSL